MKREEFNDNFGEFIKTVMKRATFFFEDETVARKLLHKSYITGLKQLSRYNDNEDFKVWFARIMGRQYRLNIERWKAEKEAVIKTVSNKKNPLKLKKQQRDDYYIEKRKQVNLKRFRESVPDKYREMMGKVEKENSGDN